MSKKMMKRSLALGALMAFVITGSALAAEATITSNNFTGIDNAVWNIEDGFYHKSEINNNSITINGSGLTFTDAIYGAYANVSADTTANSNNIIINSEITHKSSSPVYGAYISVGVAEACIVDNKIEINKNITGQNSISNIVGAFARGNSVKANGNSIVIDNAIVSSSVTAVEVLGTNLTVENNRIEIGGNSELQAGVECVDIRNVDSNGTISVRNNTITIKDTAKVYAGTEGVDFSSTSQGDINFDISGNVVNVEDSATVDNVYGARFYDGSVGGLQGKVILSGNTVNLNDSANVTGNVYGAYISVESENSSAHIKVQGNIVNIGGNVNFPEDSKVYGGYASSMSTTEMNASATGNTVKISGNAVVNGEVYGGYAETYSYDITGMNPVPSTVNASGNEIIVSGAADVSNAMLAGGKTFEVTVGMNGSEPVITPTNNSDENTSQNKFTITEDWTGDTSSGKKIKTVENFDIITLETAKADDPITIANLNLKKENTDGTGGTAIVVEKLQVSGDGAEEGTKIKLFSDNTAITGDLNAEESKATIYVGTSEKGTAKFENLSGGTGGIEMTVQELDLNPQVLVIGESRAAATAFVNQGSEIIETGLDALARDNAKAGDTKVFAAVYGNASEYATGSHVKVNGWSGIVGVGKTDANGLTVGAFFENGEGNYRTYNTVNNEFMRGDGEANYNGGGFLIRKDNANGVYTEASLRAGNLQNELRKAVRGSEGLAGYDVDTFYYGAHIGVGKVIPRGNEGDSIDVYGKFIYTHHDSENFDIDGSDFHFDSVDSERLRLGFRINEVQTNKLSMYYGAAWEYEFGGDADNTTVGYDLSTPSLGGSTVIGEIGMHYLASEKWSLDLNVRGYSGQRDGFTGSVQANYNF